MATRWLSSILVRWAPVLTFNRRRDEVLEWVEANTEPVAFHDSERTLGLAFGHSDMRLTLGRRSLLLSSGASGDSMQDLLEEPLSGILNIITPAQARVSSVSFKMSAELPGADYADATKAFARRAHGGVTTLAGWTSSDAAVLTDLETEGFTGLVDYGIVERSEIQDRVSAPEMGRVNSRADTPSDELLAPRVADAPEVSVFVDSNVVPDPQGYVASSAEIWGAYVEAEARVSALTDALAETMTSDGGEA